MADAPAQPDAQDHGNQLTRREVLRGAAAGGMALGMGGALATAASAATAPKIKNGGTMNVGLASGSPADTLNIHKVFLFADSVRVGQIYEPLVDHVNNWKRTYVLAKSIEPEGNTADTWIIKLRPGIHFHDGKPFTADDVIFSMQAMITTPGSADAKPLAYVDYQNLKKLDNLTVRVPLHTPVSVFPDDMVRRFIGPAGYTYDPANPPPGTGPFMFKSFDPGHQSTMVRNPNYWQGKVKLDQLVIYDFPDDTARVNALLGGSVDVISGVPNTQIGQIQGHKNLKLLHAQTDSFRSIALNLLVPPFDDNRVREAIRLLVDRPQYIKQILNGHGRLGNDVFSIDDPVYDSKLPQRHHDPEKAKFLLKKAGQSDITFQITATATGGEADSALVMSQQMNAAGVKGISVNTVDTQTLYGPNYHHWPAYMSGWEGELYTTMVAYATASTAPYNTTNFHNPRYDSLFAQALKETNDAKRTVILHELQKMDYLYGGYVIPAFQDQYDAYNAKLTGFVPDKTGLLLHNYWKAGFVA